MTGMQHNGTAETGASRLRREAARFQEPVLGISLWQIASSFVGFLATCGAMYGLLEVSSWAALALAPLAAGFLVRIFIIQHDCGHRAFFRSTWANDLLGFACSVLTLTPYLSWRRQHAGHHRIWNDLDRRESGVDMYSSCLTVVEYQALSPWARWRYRVIRHPLVANVLLPPLIFILLYRLPFDMPAAWRRERRVVHLTTAAVAAVLGGLGLWLGYGAVAAVQLPVMAMAAIAGVWLFTVQHRGPTTEWTRHDAWDSIAAALHGSTYLRLPKILQWFTGNIGFHHVHHLNPRIPNYRLQECHDRIAALSAIPALSFRDGLRASALALWDERAARLVTFRAAAVPATA